MWFGCDGICLGLVRFALRLGVFLCLVECCCGSWVLLGIFDLLCVTQDTTHKNSNPQVSYVHVYVREQGSVWPPVTGP